MRPAGSGSTAAEFLLAIPDWVDRVAEQNGERLVVRFRPGELPEHGRRLVESLGVVVEISDAAPARVVLRDPVDVARARRRPVSEMAQRARTMGDFQPTQERDRQRVPATAGKKAEEMRADEAAVRDAQTVTARCALCEWTFTGRADLARREAARHRADKHADAPRGARGAEHERALVEAEWRRQRAALDRTDAGEPALEETGPAEVHRVEGGGEDARPDTTAGAGVGGARRWTLETALAAVRAYASEHGHPPAAVACRNADVPSVKTAVRLCGSWASLIEAAGFDRPVRGRRYSYTRNRKKGAGPAGEVASTAEDQPPTVGPAPEPPESLLDRVLAQMSVRDLRCVKHRIEAEIAAKQYELALIERALAHVRGGQP